MDGRVDGVVGVLFWVWWGEEQIEGNLLDVWKGRLSEEVVGMVRGEAL